MSPAKSRDLPGIGVRLRLAREAAGLTQQQIAKLLNLSRPAISEMEAETRTVSVGELKKLAHYYNVSLDWLLGEQLSSNETVKVAARKLSALKPQDMETVMRIVDSFRRQRSRLPREPK